MPRAVAKPRTSADASCNVRLLTVRQAAKQLGCSTANVYALIDEGELAVVQVGRRNGYRIDVHDLAQFIDGRKFRSAARAPVQRPARLRHIKLG